MAPSILTAEEIKKYNPRPLSNIVKLSSNENPYGPSERVRHAIIDNGLGLYFLISSAVNIEGAIINPPKPIEDLNHSRLDCIII
jgi:histidinol-phosphate/aromatic aminotransferase/cobyric acid decarboxylase-like protein